MKKIRLLAAALGAASAVAVAQPVMLIVPAADPVPDHLQVRTENGLKYVCGGIGSGEVQRMKKAASDFDLMLTFAASNGSYLADVNVSIADAKGKPVLQTTCEGPLMLVEFDQPGRYRIRAEAEGHVSERTARIGSDNKVNRVAMTWPTRLIDMGRQVATGTDARASGSSSTGSSSTGSTGSSGTGAIGSSARGEQDRAR